MQAMAHVLATPSPPRRFRVTLWATFAWLTVLTLVASHIYTSYQFHKAKQEIVKLQDQLGIVRVTDPTRLTAASADMAESYQYRFHFFRPQGRRLVLKYAFQDISQFTGSPPPAAAGELPLFLVGLDTDGENKAGEFVLVMALAKGATTTQLHINTRCGWHGKHQQIEIPTDTFVDHFFRKTQRGGRGGSTWGRLERTTAPQPDVPLVLLRITEDGKTHKQEGLIVWLENAAPPTAP